MEICENGGEWKDMEELYPNGDMEAVSTAQEIQRFAFFAHVHSVASVWQPILNLRWEHSACKGLSC